MTASGSAHNGAPSSAPGFLETGVPNLDRILGGGLQKRTLAMVMGAPGAGKTMLAQQIAFHVARHGGPVLYLTGYSETHDKLLANSRELTFFDATAVGRQIQFLNLVDLMREGAEETEAALVHEAQVHAARLLILDGFRSIRRFLASDQEVAHFLYSLGAKLSVLGATTLLCLEGDPAALPHDPELTVCDAIISLKRAVHGSHERRVLEAVKVRGAAPLLGPHLYTIANDGITLYPRWESIVEPEDVAWSDEKLSFGIHAVDSIFGGGPTAQTLTLVAGTPGVGKTLLGLHFLTAAKHAREPALYVGFRETHGQLRQHSQAFGLDLAEEETAGRLRLLVLPSYDLDADRIAAQISQDIEERGVRRLMIDSLTEVERGVHPPDRRMDFLAALLVYLRNQRVTTLATVEIASVVSPTLEFGDLSLYALADNFLLLRFAEYQNRLHRLMAVLKMRFSGYDPTLYEYSIEPGRGIAVTGPAPAAIGLLTGIAQPIGGWSNPPLGESEG